MPVQSSALIIKAVKKCQRIADLLFSLLVFFFSSVKKKKSNRIGETAKEHHPYKVRSRTVPVIARYAIDYENIDLKRFTFSGFVDIELDVKEESDFIMLNAKELTIPVVVVCDYLLHSLHRSR